MVDLLMRDGLSRLTRFFPQWLQSLKAVVSFIRDVGYRDDLVRRLRRAGKGALASMLKSVSVETFANWRWHKLVRIIRGLKGVLRSWAANMNWEWVAGHRDTTLIAQLRRGLTSNRWFEQFDFVEFFFANG